MLGGTTKVGTTGVSGWTGVKVKKESGTGGAAIAGGNCDGGCGPGGGVNGSLFGMSPGVS